MATASPAADSVLDAKLSRSPFQ